MLQEMRLAVFMAKAMEHTTYRTQAKDVFHAATLGGAKAFGRTDIGRLCDGAKSRLHRNGSFNH